jgi:dUTP pyrophosphatase
LGAFRIRVAVKRVGDVHVDLPKYMTRGSAGMDLCAALEAPITLESLDRTRVPCGFAIAIPDGYEGQIRPRSGLAWKHGLSIPNAPGTIDSDYRGEVAVLLVNLGKEPITLEPGQRIAQLVVAPVARADLDEVAELVDTSRGSGGFGHTRS